MDNYTTTEYDDYMVFEYNVYWAESVFITDEWKHKPFANKKDAQDFAKRHKKKGVKPYPYIVKTITSRNTFRKDVKVELCNIDFKYATQHNYYRKIVRY